jgi:hypothetical protein
MEPWALRKVQSKATEPIQDINRQFRSSGVNYQIQMIGELDPSPSEHISGSIGPECRRPTILLTPKSVDMPVIF